MGELVLIVGSFVGLLVVGILVVGGIAFFIADRAGGGQKTEILRRILELTARVFAYSLFGLWIIGSIIFLIAVFLFGYEI